MALCIVCKRPAPAGASLCTSCAAQLAPVARSGIERMAQADRDFAEALFPNPFGPNPDVLVVSPAVKAAVVSAAAKLKT